MHAHMEEAPVPPGEIVAGLPSALSSAILKALAKNPVGRFQTAEEFRTALEGRGDARPLPETIALTRPLSTGTGNFELALLAKVESALLPVLGPIAKNLVLKEARRCATYQELCSKLGEQISDSRDRDAFLRFCEGSGSVTRQSAVHWDAPVLDAAKKKLAAHLGPIAGVVVERAARRVRTPRELYEALAANIPDERDRREFLRSAPE
jgi:serine/threonine-protein kinase